jgi:hypothetical protein
VSRFKQGLERFHGFCARAERDPAEIAIALRVLAGPGGRPRATIEGEPDMFSGGDADWVTDIKALRDLGVSAVDVRLLRRTPDDTIDAMRRFADGVLAKL